MSAATPDEVYVCELDGATFSSRNRLFRHMRENYPEGGKFQEPPSKVWEANRQSAPEVHAKAAGNIKKGKQQKKPKAEKGASAEPKEKPSLKIETRPAAYQDELKDKAVAMQKLLESFGNKTTLPEAEVFASSPEHFRMRVEFDMCNKDGVLNYAMHVGKDLVVVNEYPMCCKLISQKLMPDCLEILRKEELLRERLFEINFHATLHGDAVISLLYRTPMNRTGRKERMLAQSEAREAFGKTENNKLTEEWRQAAERLSNALGGVSIVGRTRGQKVVIGHQWIQEELKVVGVEAPLRYRQLESFFSQSNAEVCQHMLAWSRAVAYADDAPLGVSGPARDDDLLELYCGNGNFCVALAPLFRNVFATEMVKELLDLVKHNAEDNKVDNITVGRVSAEELVLAMDGLRKFTRLEHVDLKSYNFQTVLVDPPRAGLGPEVSKCLSRFPRIVYVSCNPVTLRDDLVVLSKTHEIKRLAAFDQFPYTDHLEMGILLVRREGMSSETKKCGAWALGAGLAALILLGLSRRA